MREMLDEVLYSGNGKPESSSKAYGKAFEEAGRRKDNVVSLTADMTSILEVDLFRVRFPERTFSMGMAEQNMIGVAAVLASAGEIPFAHSFACFITRRCMDQIVNSVAYPRKNVKLVGMMPGISSPGGASHQAIDDIAFMRTTPNMSIIDLGDSTETGKAVQVALEADGPVYIRIRRGVLPVLFDPEKYVLELGQSYLLRKGTDVAIITSGLMTERALVAGKLLEEQGISSNILHVPSIKPLDVDGVLEVVSRSTAVITLDNHSIIGGLGSAVSDVLTDHKISKPFQRIGLQDRFGKAGSMPYLARLFGMEPDQIAQSAASLLDDNNNIQFSAKLDQVPVTGAGWDEEWKN